MTVPGVCFNVGCPKFLLLSKIRFADQLRRKNVVRSINIVQITAKGIIVKGCVVLSIHINTIRQHCNHAAES